MNRERVGLLAGASAYILWGLLTVYWKQLEGLSPVELIGQRVVWSFLLLAVVVLVLHRARAILALRHRPYLVARLGLAAVFLSVNWLTYVWAVTHDNVVETALGYFMAPIATVVLGVVVLHERLRRTQWAALGLAGAAVVVLTVSYGRPPWYALTLAASWTVYSYLKKTVPLAPLESLTGETGLLLLPALAVIAVGSRHGDGILATATTTQIVLVLLLGVVTTTPLLLFAVAAQRVPLTLLGPLQYFVPTINFLLGVFVYHETMTADRLVGFALVWVALVLFTTDAVAAARARGSAPLEALDEMELAGEAL